MTQVLVQFYADATAPENPLGLSPGFPWLCREFPDDIAATIPVPSGQVMMDVEDYHVLAASFRVEYEEALAVYRASLPPPPPEE